MGFFPLTFQILVFNPKVHLPNFAQVNQFELGYPSFIKSFPWQLTRNDKC